MFWFTKIVRQSVTKRLLNPKKPTSIKFVMKSNKSSHV